MAKKTWKIKVDKKEHSVEFHTGGFRSMPTLSVDGKPLETSAVPKAGRFPMFSEFTANFRNKELMVRMSTNGFYNTYELAVDHISAVTGQPMKPGAVIPTWTWPFFAACIFVTFVDLQNFILSLVALTTGFGCIAIASSPSRKLSTKLIACIAFTAIAWIVYLVMRK